MVEERRKHTSEQIKHTLPTGPSITVGKELHYQNERIRNLVLGNLGNGQQEVRDSRVSMDGQSHPLLSERLKHDFSRIEEETDKLLNVTDDPAYLFNPPYMKSAERGVNETPLSNDPTENLKAFMMCLSIINIVSKSILVKTNQTHTTYIVILLNQSITVKQY